MSDYCFGLHNGHLTAKADRIAARYGAWHINYTEPSGWRRGWFACPNRGSPFDSNTAAKVWADLDKAGGIEKLLHKQDQDQD